MAIGPGLLQEHHPLAQRRMIGFRNHGVLATVGEPGAEHERVRDQAADGIAGRGELCGLRDRVAEDQLRPDGIPQSALAQHRFRGLAVRSDLRIGDREAGSPRRP